MAGEQRWGKKAAKWYGSGRRESSGLGEQRERKYRATDCPLDRAGKNYPSKACGGFDHSLIPRIFSPPVLFAVGRNECSAPFIRQHNSSSILLRSTRGIIRWSSAIQ